MKSFLLHSLLVVFPFIFLSLWAKTSLEAYTVPLLSIITIVALLTINRKHKNSHKKELITAPLLTISVLLLISTTGNLESILFFLSYFLCFYLAFALSPEMVFVFSAAIMVWFLPDKTHLSFFPDSIKLGSLLLISPLAYFFGKAIAAKEQQDQRSQRIIADVAEIIATDGEELQEENVERLRDIVTQSRLTKIIILGFFLTAILWLNTSKTSAAGMTDENYSIETDIIGLPSDKSTLDQEEKQRTPKPQLPKTVGENYTITIGTGESTTEALSAKISEDIISFGILSATNPVIRTTNITITSPLGYQVFGSIDHPLQNNSNAIIPDTTCDTGQCSETIPAVWTNTLTYGFGYRCDDVVENNCDTEFREDNSFKQFADRKTREYPQTIMQSGKTTKNSQGEITYKLNISGTQAAGSYSNTVTYLAVPNF
jgi:hypothetical protein